MPWNKKNFFNILNSLQHHLKDDNPLNIRKSFFEDFNRFKTFSVKMDDLIFDFSRSNINKKTIKLLENIAYASDIFGRRDSMFSGKNINETQNLPALHVALRAPRNSNIYLNGKNIIPSIQNLLKKMERFCNAIRNGIFRGKSGKKFTDVLHIGIGGSYLGPAMVTHAMKPYHDGPDCHFVSNIDSSHISDTIKKLDPSRTLIIIASKTFETKETIVNAYYSRKWIKDSLGEHAISEHFVAISSAFSKVRNFGIKGSRIFGFYNWIGGRYSIWTTIGLVFMIAIGCMQFRRFLAGAYAMDQHFLHTPIKKNIPIILGLIGFWNRVVCKYSTRAIIPYEQRLWNLPAYLQQLEMESNGKSITLHGEKILIPTGPIIWGGTGTNEQHSFFQMLHQGTDIVPVEFIAFVNGHDSNFKHQRNILLANCLAQAETLVFGLSKKESLKRLIYQGLQYQSAKKLAPHVMLAGNRPSIIIMQNILTPFTLGRLLALYEHRVFVEGSLMNINSFDQWGVELGKELSKKILKDIECNKKQQSGNTSNLGLLSYIKKNSFDRNQKKR